MSDRLTRIRLAMQEAGLAGFLIASPVDDVFGRHSQNRRYVSGFTGSTGYVLLTETRALIGVDSRYTEQAERESVRRGFELFDIKGRRDRAVVSLLAEAGLAGKPTGISGADLSYGEYARIQAALDEVPSPERPLLRPAPHIVEDLRAYKDADELASLQRAIDIGDQAYEHVLAVMEAGLAETDIALAVETAVRHLGGSGVSFDTIVAGGPWAAMPHASPRDEPLAPGETVVIDMGAIYNGYCSDLTRTTTIGPGGDRFREIYEVVFAAQQNAIERVESGMPGSEAHNLAHEVISAAGYGEQFGHGLGHGVGLEVHEKPYLGMTSEDVLEEGMVFTIEPGIYIPGWGGVRIEDIVVLKNGRAQVLSHATKLIPGAF